MGRFMLTRINPLLATMAAESRQSMAQIAAQAVIYSHQHVAYEDEIAKED